jgi:hypothetical protein
VARELAECDLWLPWEIRMSLTILLLFALPYLDGSLSSNGSLCFVVFVQKTIRQTKAIIVNLGST